jgi:hypothetical protein
VISVQVRRENGEILAKDAVDRRFNPLLFGIDYESFPMLGSIDPDGDTVFNGLQVKRLMIELETRYSARCCLTEFLQQLNALCVLTLSGSHRFLWFIGY